MQVAWRPFLYRGLSVLHNMKSKALAPQFGDTKLGHRTPALHDLADFYVTDVGQFAGLHVQVAVG